MMVIILKSKKIKEKNEKSNKQTNKQPNKLYYFLQCLISLTKSEMELCSEGELSLDDESIAHYKEGIKWPLEQAVLHSWVGVLIPKIIVLKSGRKTSSTDIRIGKVRLFKRLECIYLLIKVNKNYIQKIQNSFLGV